MKLKTWQKNYLKDFIARWEIMYERNSEDDDMGDLCREFKEFVDDNKLPHWSAEDLLAR